MINENMEFWQSVKKTDPKRVKPITGKPYQGNSPQPYYLVERMTEQFGMCGIGWGINIISERMERLTETDVLHIAVIELWYIHCDKRGSISQIGQTKACYLTNANKMMIDEDAPKKSVTDAMTKCMSYLGFAGDIFSGLWDDSKYVNELKQDFNQQHTKELIDKATHSLLAAGTIDDLRINYTAAVEMFGATDEIIAAKNKRRAELTPTPTPAEKES